MPKITNFPKLMRTPHTVEEALFTAGQDPAIRRVLIIGETAAGEITLVNNNLTYAQANWLLDRAKFVIHRDVIFDDKDEVPVA